MCFVNLPQSSHNFPDETDSQTAACPESLSMISEQTLTSLLLRYDSYLLLRARNQDQQGSARRTHGRSVWKQEPLLTVDVLKKELMFYS